MPASCEPLRQWRGEGGLDLAHYAPHPAKVRRQRPAVFEHPPERLVGEGSRSVVAANSYPEAAFGGRNDQVEKIAHALVVFVQRSDLVLGVAAKVIAGETTVSWVLDQHRSMNSRLLMLCTSAGCAAVNSGILTSNQVGLPARAGEIDIGWSRAWNRYPSAGERADSRMSRSGAA